VLLHAGSGAALLFLLGIAAAVLWAVVYAELGSAYPYAGGDYVGVGSILGPWAGAATLVLWTVTAGPSVAFEAHIVSDYVRELAPNLPDAGITFGAVGAALVIALLAVRTGAWVTGIFLAVEMVAVLGLAGAGFWHPVRSLTDAVLHPVALAISPGGAGNMLAPVALAVLASAGVNAAFGTVGGNQAIYFGEELRDPHHRMGRVILMATMTGALATALPVIAVVLGARDLGSLLHSPAPFATFMSQTLGAWAGPTLSAGVALAVFNAVIAQMMQYARLFYSVARDGLFPGPVNRLFVRVHQGSGVPRTATLVMGGFTALCCLFSAHALLVFISGLLVYGWSLVCLAVLVGRAKGLTGKPGYWRAWLHPVAPVLGLVLAAIFAVADLADPDAGRPSLILLGIIMVIAIVWSQTVLKRRGWTPALADVAAID
jgi:amino acid transporter